MLSVLREMDQLTADVNQRISSFHFITELEGQLSQIWTMMRNIYLNIAGEEQQKRKQPQWAEKGCRWQASAVRLREAHLQHLTLLCGAVEKHSSYANAAWLVVIQLSTTIPSQWKNPVYDSTFGFTIILNNKTMKSKHLQT